MELKTFEPYDIVLSGEVRRNWGGIYDDVDEPLDEPSYSKYGGYNGYDDDTIDSAFESIPEATWNID